MSLDDGLFIHDEDRWLLRAACRGVAITDGHYKRFFGKAESGRKELCAVCPVTVECLAYSERFECEFGTFGGLAPIERQKFLSAHGSVNTYKGRAAHERAMLRLRREVAEAERVRLLSKESV